MAGHSRWANIKHRKARADARRGKVFSKIVKELTVSAKLGGSDPTTNPRLRAAVEKARAENMPADTIDRAVKKGAGELEGVNYEEGIYEGYGPGGVAVLVSYMTDNKNRTASDVRHVFSKYGGSLGSSGSVLWMFEKRSFFIFKTGEVSEERLFDAAIEAGAEDVKTNAEEGVYEVYAEPHDFHKIKSSFDSEGLRYEQAEVTMMPKNLVQVSGKTAEHVLHLLDALEDLDDVQNVYANFDIPAEEIEMVEMA